MGMTFFFAAYTITVTKDNPNLNPKPDPCADGKHNLFYDPFGDDADGKSGYYCGKCERKFGPLNMPAEGVAV
jgi:hypothetical protein